MKNNMFISIAGVFIVFLFMSYFVQAQSWDKTQPNILFATDKSHRFENVKVGIGTNTPLFPLEVKGKIVTDSMHIHGKLQIGDSTFSFVPNEWNIQSLQVDHIRSDNGIIALMEGDNSSFSSNVKVGIGTDDPFGILIPADYATTFGLEVNGDINITDPNNTGTYRNHGYRIRGVTVLQTQWNNANNMSLENIFVGEEAGNGNTTGGNNTFVGSGAGRHNTEGQNNTFIGRTAGDLNVTGSGNVYVGDDAGHFNTNGMGLNTFIGSRSGFSIIGERNSFLGFSAGDDMTGGAGNIMIGEASGTNLQTGNGNIFIGQNTNIGTGSTATNSILLGTNSSTNNFINAIAIGFRAFVGASNSMVLGSINGVNGYSGATTRVGIGTTTPQRRLEIVDGTLGSSGLRLTSLTNAQPINIPVNGILSVNPVNGDVILVDAPGGGANICAGMLDNRLTKFVAGSNELCNSMVYDNDFSVGIGNFAPGTNLSAVFTVNSNAGLVPSSGLFELGEVFTTDCPFDKDTYWRMCRGGDQMARFYNEKNNNNLYIEAVQPNSNIIFNVGTANGQLNGAQVSRMIITDGITVPGGGNSGFVGIGTNFLNPQSMLHIHDGFLGVFSQYTNISSLAAGQQLPANTDGFRVGIWANGSAILNQQEDLPIFFNTNAGANNQSRMTVWHSPTNETRVGIGTGNILAERALEVFSPDNPQLRLSRRITGHIRYTDFETTPAGHLRINPKDGDLFADNGRVGINLTAGLEPQNTLEINSGLTSPSNSGLRFTNLNSFSPVVTNPGNGVLTVDEDGDVILVEDGGSSGGIGTCANPTNLIDNSGIKLNDYNFYFIDDNVPNQNLIGVGYPCNSTDVKAKVDVIQNSYSDIQTSKYSIGVSGKANNLDANQSIGIYGEATSQNNNTNYGVKGKATSSDGNNYGLFGEANSTNGNNYGIHGSASSPSPFNCGVYSYASSPSLSVNYGINSNAMSSNGINYGIKSSASGSSLSNYGINTTATSPNGENYGVKCAASNSSFNNYGVHSVAHSNSGVNYGIYSEAYTSVSSGTATNYALYTKCLPNNPLSYAGYFDGNVNIEGHVTYITQSSTSDSIFKNNINYYDGALEKISNLNPCTFNYKTSDFPTINLPEGNQYGLISQEVESVFPDLIYNLIRPAEFDTLGNMLSDTIHYKALNYTGLIPILTQGIKELDAKTDSIAAIPAEADNDWAHIPGAGILTGYTNNDGLNSENVYIGFQPTEIPTLAMPVKMAVFADQGGIGTNNEFGLVTGGFRNMMVHSDSPNSTTHAYGVFSESMGDGCSIRTSANYGLRAQADNAKNNYGGYFRAYAQNICSRNNYAVYADCPVDETKNNFAGYFNGNLAYTGNLSFQSDIMLKENVAPVANAIDVLNQLNPVSFNFKTAQFPTMNMPAGTHFGLIAQEVEPLIPEVVSNNFFPAQYDDNGTMLSDTFTYKSIDYTKLIPHMIEAIKELSQQNQDLQNQVTQMQDIIASCCNEARNSTVNVTIETRPVVVPAQNTTLNQNYPNPFKTITTFTYTLGESGNCELIIEDTYGRTVATLVNEPQQTGNYSVEWEASSQPAGIYFYSLRVNGKVLVKKAIKIE